MWSWDNNKAAANIRKHKVSFQLAQRVFDDPLALTMADPYPNESRLRTLGQPSSASHVLLFVVHTPEDQAGNGRIISARPATKHERKAYEGR